MTQDPNLSPADEKLSIAIQSLKAIAYPVEYLKNVAKREDAEFNGQMAIEIANHAPTLQEWAKDALKAMGHANDDP